MVAGVDGCPAGWVMVLAPAAGPPVARIERSFAAILAAVGAPDIIAVDMPIGLPDMITDASQAREREARAGLGARQSSLFTVPCRAALEAEEFRAACAINRARSFNGKAISKQMFHLFPKIREIDALMTPALAARVHEAHPEVAFWAMNGCRALATPKKIKGSPNPDGLEERIRLLTAVAGFPDAFLRVAPGRGCGPDDLLDAAACAWSARRIARGEAIVFPAQPLSDGRGLPMTIKA